MSSQTETRLVGEDTGPAEFSHHTCQSTTYYLGYIGFFESIVNRISIGHLTGEKLNEIFISFPETNMQNTIVKHIQAEAKRINIIISKIETEIHLIQEYRTSLISEVVTGKIKVA